MGTKNFYFFFQKSLKLNSTCILTCAEELKSFKWVATCTYRSTSGMHRRPFEGRHLVEVLISLLDVLIPLLVYLIPLFNVLILFYSYY